MRGVDGACVLRKSVLEAFGLSIPVGNRLQCLFTIYQEYGQHDLAAVVYRGMADRNLINKPPDHDPESPHAAITSRRLHRRIESLLEPTSTH